MAKLTLATIVNGFSADAINANFDAIETAVENTLSRDGSTPNTMGAQLDMNSKQVINLGTPTTGSSAATKTYVDSLLSGTADTGSAQLRADLLDDGGAALIGTIRSDLAGAYSSTLEARLLTSHINVCTDWGVEYDGTDQSAKIVAGFADLVGGEVVYFPPTRGAVFKFESTVLNPHTGSGTQCGVVLDSLENVYVFGHGCVITQSVANNAVLGIFCVFDSVNCHVHGFHVKGSYNAAGSTWTNAMVGIMAGSIGVTVTGSMDGGYALCHIINRTSANNGVLADEPKQTQTTGWVKNTRRTVSFIGAGRGHIFDVRAQEVGRSMFFGGVSGVIGRAVGLQTTSLNEAEPTLVFDCSDAAVNADIDLTVDLRAPDDYGPGFAFQSNDGSAGTHRDITIRGHIYGAGGVALWELNAASTANMTLDNIDLSDLSMYAVTQRGISIIPAATCVMRDVFLPKRIYCASTGNCLTVDNALDADMDGLHIPSNAKYRIATATTGRVIDINSAGTGVAATKNVTIGEGSIFHCTGTVANATRMWVSATDVTLGKFRLVGNGWAYFGSSSNVSVPAIYDHSPAGTNVGFTFSGAVTDGMNLSGVDKVRLTSGSATITNLARIMPLQEITFTGSGGTQLFQDGTNLKLNGDITMAAGTVLKLVCTDPPANGPLATSTMMEVSRSVN